MTEEKGYEIIDRMAVLKFFPSIPAAVAEIHTMLCGMCETDADGERLMRAILEHWSEWEGPASLRHLWQGVNRKAALEDSWRPTYTHAKEKLCDACGSSGIVTRSGVAVECECGELRRDVTILGDGNKPLAIDREVVIQKLLRVANAGLLSQRESPKAEIVRGKGKVYEIPKAVTMDRSEIQSEMDRIRRKMDAEKLLKERA